MTTKKNTIHLLLPAPNGVFPYLTPSLVERYFGSFGRHSHGRDDHDNGSTGGSNTENLLWLGVAVRDTCVAPSFASDKTNQSKKNKNKSNNDNGKGESNNTSHDGHRKKPIGYSISFPSVSGTATTVGKDEAVLPNFTHVTVPSFDLIQDEMDYYQQQQHRKAVQKTRNNNGSNASSTTGASTTTFTNIDSTNRHVMVWTPHGRQTLTPEQYQQASMGLNSSFTVSLYDQCHVHDTNISRRRRQLMKQRNADWLKQIIQTNNNKKDKSTNPKFVLPWVIQQEENEATQRNNPRYNTGELARLLQQHRSHLAGIALIGWPLVTGSQEGEENQRRLQNTPWLSSLVTHCQEWKAKAAAAISAAKPDDSHVPLLMVLETRSLAQILNAMQMGGINVIGTSLPMMWARQHKAWVLDFQSYLPNNKATTEPDLKRRRLDPSSTLEQKDSNVITCDENGCWDMSLKQFQLDDQPLVKNCTCFACAGGDGGGGGGSTFMSDTSKGDVSNRALPQQQQQQHPAPYSRAYVHHLVQTQELLGEMLLFAHNLHHMLLFFQHVSERITPEEFQPFRDYLQGQLATTSQPTTPPPSLDTNQSNS